MRAVCALTIAAAACAGPGRPTVTGLAMYAHVEELKAHGQATVDSSAGPLVVRRQQVLVTHDSSKLVYELDRVLQTCNGGPIDDDVECMLALQRSQSFIIQDQTPPPATTSGRDPLRTTIVVGLGVVAAGLTVGVLECDFPGCKALFGVPAVLAASFFAIGLLGPD
jgi:hypothetical protein